MDTTSALPQIDETLLATTRYLQALTLLDERSVHRPSGLPGWTRAHVVAHVSRNADSFTRVLAQVAAGEAASMYPSAEERNTAIDETVATHDMAGLVADAIASAARLTDAFWACTADHATPYTRVPGGEEVFLLDTLGPRRRLEVEVHHCDLETGYLPTEWPLDFARHVVQMRARELGARVSMRLTATDTDGTWSVGRGTGPQVDGAVGDLAWWLLGRGGGRGLTCSPGDLPVLGRWR